MCNSPQVNYVYLHFKTLALQFYISVFMFCPRICKEKKEITQKWINWIVNNLHVNNNIKSLEIEFNKKKKWWNEPLLRWLCNVMVSIKATHIGRDKCNIYLFKNAQHWPCPTLRVMLINIELLPAIPKKVHHVSTMENPIALKILQNKSKWFLIVNSVQLKQNENNFQWYKTIEMLFMIPRLFRIILLQLEWNSNAVCWMQSASNL